MQQSNLHSTSQVDECTFVTEAADVLSTPTNPSKCCKRFKTTLETPFTNDNAQNQLSSSFGKARKKVYD